jgi:hypothetical protein
MYQIEGGRSPTFGIWIVGHLDDFGEDYPNQMKRLYNSFLVEGLGTESIEYQTMLRYIRLLAAEQDGILVESDTSDHAIQEQTEGTQFPKNYYRIANSFSTDWASKEPAETAFIEELREPLPDVLLDPWNGD